MRASEGTPPGARGALLVALALCCAERIVPARAPDPACSTAAGRIDGILVGNEARNAVERTQMAVARSGETVGARNGMPLCVGDVVTTGANVRSHLRLDSVPDAEKWITLDPESYIQIVDGSSLFFRLGRLFASLRGRFEVQTPFARLGARGTEFQIEARADSVDVVQLEGAVDVTPGTGLFPQADLVAPAPRVLLVGWPGGQRNVAPPRPPPQAAALQLDRLTRLTIGPQQGTRIVAADRDEVARTVDANCLAIIATRPASPSQSFIRLFDSPEARATAYRTARVRATLTPEPEQFAELARAYTDFGEARRAVRAFEQAGDPSGSGRERAIRLNEMGDAHRLKGDLAAAESTYRRALAADPVFAFPYNGLGDVYKDQALAALDRGEPDAGESLLLKARELYDHSLDESLWGKEGGRNRAVPFNNLGVVWLQIAQVKAASRADVQQAEYYLVKAEDDFRRALAASPGYAFAEVGVGRVFAARAALYAGTGRRDLAGENVERARLHLERVAERYPAFAVARQALGEVLELANDAAAPAAFLRATELDPSYPLAYFRLARSLQRSARADDARLYYQAYLRMESPAFRGGERYATARAGAGVAAPGGAGIEPKPPAPPAGTSVAVPALAGMSQADAIAALAAVRLAVGRVQTRSGAGNAGTVIDQSVKPGTQLPPGSTIDLVLAGSGRTVKVPDLVGDDREKAVRRLREKNLQPGRVTARPSCEDAGEVVAQNPPEDTKVSEGTAVDLVVASTGAGIPVPTLTDLSQTDAERLLRERGLVVKRVRREETDKRPPGTVIDQQPKPNTLLAQGCPVDLRVAIAVPTVRVPRFIGTTEREARQQLPSGVGALFGHFALGTITYQETRDAAAGTVIGQNPQPGAEVPARSATPVNLIVATAASGSGDSGGGGARPYPPEPEMSSRVSVTVPDVRNRTLKVASRMLIDAGLKYTVTGGDSDTVRQQSPGPGASVRRGSTVSLTMHDVIK